MGEGWDFQKLGHCHFLTFMMGLGTVKVPVDVSFSLLMCYREHILRLKIQWKSPSLLSWT